MTKSAYWLYSAITFMIAAVLGFMAFLLLRSQQFNGLFMAGVLVIVLMLLFIYFAIALFYKGVQEGYRRTW